MTQTDASPEALLASKGRAFAAARTLLKDLTARRDRLFARGFEVGCTGAELARAGKVSRAFLYKTFGTTPPKSQGTRAEQFYTYEELERLAVQIAEARAETERLQAETIETAAAARRADPSLLLVKVSELSGLSTATLTRLRAKGQL